MKHFEFLEKKIVDLEQAGRLVAAWRVNADRIVFTNGCFDLLHRGHIHLLAEAKDLGDRIIVGLNSDASVRRLKGPNRPVQDQQTRALLLAACCWVDAVVIFDEDTPLKLIQTIQPDVLVKGGDWPADRIVGAEVVQANGGQVVSLPFLDGFSTSAIIERIMQGAS
ncbi:MAG: cytidylyltransferase [Saprospiraceae bacterium]|nr:MAG: cytidylyltransferase [Saprospiraceae bacterium]